MNIQIVYRWIFSISFLLISSACFAVDVSIPSQPPHPNCAEIKKIGSKFSNSSSWDGWGNGASNARFQSEQETKISSTDLKKLKLKWVYGFRGSSKVDAQPTVYRGVIFSSGGSNIIHAIDLNSGCTLWTTSVSARVRTAIVLGVIDNEQRLFFGDQAGTAYCLDAVTGNKIWSRKIDEHRLAQITGSPVFHKSVVYFPSSSGWEEAAAADASYECCTFRGSLTALNAASGLVVWKTFTIKEPARKTGNSRPRFGPSGAGVWSSPTLDTDLGIIYVATGNNFSPPATDTSDALIAISLESGEVLWSKQLVAKDVTNVSCYGGRQNCPDVSAPDHDFASPFILVKLDDGQRLLIGGQKSGVITALNPDNKGEIVWQRKVGEGSPLGGIQHGMSSDGRNLFAAISFVQVMKASASTRGAQRGHDDWYLLGPRGGGLHSLDIRTGKLVWSTPHPGCKQVPGCSQAQSAAISSTNSYIFSGGLDGIMRAYKSDNGEIVWSVDTKISLDGSNGIKASGGSIDGPGPVLVSDFLLISSGYQMFGGLPGNALFAFGVQE